MHTTQGGPTTELRLDGRAPWSPVMAGTLDESPDLVSALATEFAPTAAELSTPDAYWIAFNGWVTNRLSGPIMDGAVGIDELSQQVWAMYATAYWGGMELRETWGMPPAMERLGIVLEPPFTDTLQAMATEVGRRFAFLAGSDADCVAAAATLLHDGAGPGALWSTAYNAGCQVVKTEDPPIGQRRPHRRPRPSAVRINTRDFLRVDYDLPAPDYLKVWRSAFERSVVSHPDGFEQLIAGDGEQENLRDMWARGVTFGNTTWGEGANDAWTDEYFDESLHWSTVVNFGLEAVSLAAVVAVLDGDASAARRAIMGNAIYAGMATGWLLGFLDVDEHLPSVASG